METTKILMILVLAIAALVGMSYADPMGTAFTYQGHLYDNNDVANGLYDLEFILYTHPVLPFMATVDPIYVGDFEVVDGYLTVELDFGSDAFDGSARWLKIGVRDGALGDPNAYTPLSPRQELTPVPHALLAVDAANAQYADTADYIDGYDSSDFALTGHDHDSSYTLIGHSHSGADITSGSVAEAYIDALIARDSELTWGNLSGIPAGFADGVDNIGGLVLPYSGAVSSMSTVFSITNSLSGATIYAENGSSGPAVKGVGTYSGAGEIASYGGWFETSSKLGEGVRGYASNSGDYENYGGRFIASGRRGFGVYGYAMNPNGINYGVYGKTSSAQGYGGYFEGDGYFSGSVGIGITDPSEKLEVAGNIKIDGGGNGIEFPDGSVQATAAASQPSGFCFFGDTETPPVGYTHTGSFFISDKDGIWVRKASMPTARTSLSVAAVNGKIYAIGGNDGSYLAVNEEYDPAANTWSARADMPTARHGLAAAAVNGKIYAIGGYGGSYLAVNEEFSPTMYFYQHRKD